jgi:PQQ-dependent dehydrogenase (methanol/ethanol family)
VTAERIITADREPGNWLSHSRSYDEQRFSPLAQISPANVNRLGLAWFHEFDDSRVLQATPLVIDGVLYTTSSWSKVFAFDARTGQPLWSFDPEVPPETAAKGCCDVANRGLAAWGDSVFVGTYDGRLIALDKRTGKQRWSVVTVDQSQPYTITGAPRVINGMVLIGNGGGELGVRGYLSAYDASTGRQLWRFYTVPGDPAEGPDRQVSDQPLRDLAAPTWHGRFWENGAGGTVWDALAYDPELDLLFVGVGNGSPWNHQIRSEGRGDNLFLSSIVALRPKTGAYVWHYQTTPGDSWDFTATQHMILADLQIEGRTRKVLMQAPKNGFFYVLDRTNGALISARNFVPLTWATGVDMRTGRPIEVPGARYTEKPFLMLPSALGAHNWHPMAFHPGTGLVYIPAMEIPYIFGTDQAYARRPGQWNLGIDTILAAIPDDKATRQAIRAMLKGRLVAWDPVTQQARWSVEYGGPWNGGVVATAGNLVFQGTADGRFVAYHAATGERLWQMQAQTGVIAGPITYAVDGEQYVAVMAGWGGAYALTSAFVDRESMGQAARLLVFKLDGKAELPPLTVAERVAPELPAPASTQMVALGKQQYYANCGWCHGETALSGSAQVPDLRYSALITDPTVWREVVLGGSLQSRGMIGFAKVMSQEQSEAVRAYVIEQSRLMRQHQQQASAQ